MIAAKKHKRHKKFYFCGLLPSSLSNKRRDGRGWTEQREGNPGLYARIRRTAAPCRPTMHSSTTLRGFELSLSNPGHPAAVKAVQDEIRLSKREQARQLSVGQKLLAGPELFDLGLMMMRSGFTCITLSTMKSRSTTKFFADLKSPGGSTTGIATAHWMQSISSFDAVRQTLVALESLPVKLFSVPAPLCDTPATFM